MSVYSKPGKGWRYDFVVKKKRYTSNWFEKKSQAIAAEAKKREELQNPPPPEETRTDMGFEDLVNLRLDHVKAYNSESHYNSYYYMASRWVAHWDGLACSDITPAMVQQFLLARRKVSAFAANKDLRYLRATFSFGVHKGYIEDNPATGIEFFPVDKKLRYVPTHEDIDKVIAAADLDDQDYLWTIRETLARMGEVNGLTWDDVDLDGRTVTLYTRKKRGGHRTPRKVPMTERLHGILARRHKERDPSKPWVFWHRYWSARAGQVCEGPYGDRKKIMRILCGKAGVRYFRFHALRHSGASTMERNKVPLGSIQRILGHENRKTTEIYLQSMDDAEREAMAVFERAREKSRTDSHTAEEKERRG